MQNDESSSCNDTKNEIRTLEIGEGPKTSLNSMEKSQVSSSQTTFCPDLSASEDDEVSEVDSFILDQEIEDAAQIPEESKFLLQPEAIEAASRTTVDPETHARLEALLEAAGIGKLSTADGKALTDPEVLRKLTSSVSCALDEAAAALHRMRAEQQDGNPRSLAEACSDGDVGTVQKLLHEGGSVHETTEEGESLLSLACSAGYSELAQVLLTMKANVEDRGIKGDCTPLMEASSGGYVDIVRMLIRHGADVNAQSSAGNTPLHYAACNGYEDVVQVLIEAGANVEEHNENGHTPLMEASSAGHVGVARILLSAGAGINTHSNEFKESALTLACYKGHLEMVKFLLEAGADQEHKTDEMHTALMEASMDGHVEVARLLLDSGAQVNMPADSFESPLTLAACGGHVELANLLIERGANLEEVNDEGYTPLMEAAREGHEEMVDLILAHGADINAQTEETQETALTLACCGGFLEVANFLINAGADIEMGCSTPLMEAAQEGYLELVKYLLQKGANVHAQTGTGDTALTYACENGHTDVADVLLLNEAVLEHESEGGRTPLMKAARAGHLCTVQFLISKGADVNRQTSTNDHTVLSLACAGGHLAVVELLLANGADPTHKLKDGSTMIIEAAKGGHTQVVNLLLDYPSRMLISSDLAQLSIDAPHLMEPRVPVHGLNNIVPPSEPDSHVNSAISYNIQAGSQTLHCQNEKEFNIPVRTSEQIRQNMQKSLLKRSLNTTVKNNSVPMMADGTARYNCENNVLSNILPDEAAEIKASERLEAIINNVMTKELITSGSSREEQILKKQQILGELQKVERELQEKAQAQLLLSAQHQLEQKEQQLQQVLQHVPVPLHKAYQKQLEEQVKRKRECPDDHPDKTDIDGQLAELLNQEIAEGGHNLLANYTEAFNFQPPASPVSGEMNLLAEFSEDQLARAGATVNKNGGKVSIGNPGTEVLPTNSNVDVANGPSSAVLDMVQRQHPGVAQQHQLQFQQLLPQQPDQLLQHMLSQQTLISQHQQSLQQQQQQPPQQNVPNYLTQQYLTQQQQQQLIQQHQTHQLLQQQFQIKQTTAPVLNNLQKPTARKQQQQPPQRYAQHPAQSLPGGTGILGLDTITPPPSQPLTPNPSPASPQSISPPYSPIDLDAQTESNHDTALTLACSGGHTELVSLLLSKGASIEHRDKKGFTPLILAATAGHVEVVEILLEHGGDIEAQSERTKDTPLSLACSGGRYEVVELLLARGANKEHRNVSDYTPLSLAASGGYVNIIKLLLTHGAEINSRTGSKLGISPLMLAAMNGHTAAVKLLLDMGSDINAQIETNRNTALTLACFQGRHEVVSLLVDRRANIEHRAKTGLTPLMEAASGGYVEVGRVLLDKGADVNAPPVPSSRDTALTIAADKGHYRFVDLLLTRGAAVDVKNKKGNSPLWLACNGGHLDVVQLLVSAGADIDSQDNRKVSCLMSSFRKGHIKVVKWMVKHVNQFPSDPECSRYIATITDKDLQKKCQQCMEVIVSAKVRQAAEANKYAIKLLEELDKERQVEESKRAAAVKKREKRKKKKQEKLLQEKEREASKSSSPEPEETEDRLPLTPSPPPEPDKPEPPPDSMPMNSGSINDSKPQSTTNTISDAKDNNNRAKVRTRNRQADGLSSHSKITTEMRKNKRNRPGGLKEADAMDNDLIIAPGKVGASNRSTIIIGSSNAGSMVVSNGHSARFTDHKGGSGPVSNMGVGGGGVTTNSSGARGSASSESAGSNSGPKGSNAASRKKKRDLQSSAVSTTAIGDLDDFGTIPNSAKKLSDREIDRLTKSVEKVKLKLDSFVPPDVIKTIPLNSSTTNTLHIKNPLGMATSPKRGLKKEEGWKEVIRKSKKITVPSAAISRVIGRGGCNINAIREVSGAHIEVEKQKGSGDRVVTIKGSADATRQAHALINALVTDPDKELIEILPKHKKIGEWNPAMALNSIDGLSTSVSSGSATQNSVTNVKSPSVSKSTSAKNQWEVPSSSSSASRPSSLNTQHTSAWSSVPTIASPRRNKQKSSSASSSATTSGLQTMVNIQHFVPSSVEKPSSVSRQLFIHEKKRSDSPVVTSAVTFSLSTVTVTTTASFIDIRATSAKSQPKPGSVKVLQRPSSVNAATMKHDPQPLPIVSNNQPQAAGPSNLTERVPPINYMPPPVSNPSEYSPFQLFYDEILNKKEDGGERMNFASVAAAGVITSLNSGMNPVPLMHTSSDNPLNVNLQAKAPGYKAGGQRSSSPQLDMSMGKTSGFKTGSFHPPIQFVGEGDMSLGFRGAMASMVNSNMSPRSNTSTPSGLSPRGRASTPLDSSQNSGSSITSLSSQREEYSTPDQPMTLPRIESTLNPNAPNFFSRSCDVGDSGQPSDMPLNFLAANAGMFGNLPPPTDMQALYQQAMNPTFPSNGASFNNPSAAQSNFIPPGNMPQMDFSQNLNLLHQLSQGTSMMPQQNVPRQYTPLPTQVRPNSAPSVSGVPKDRCSPVAMVTPNAPSPIPSRPSPPPEQLQSIFEEPNKLLRPIGGERSLKKIDLATLWALNSGSEMNSEWLSGTLMTSAVTTTSVMTSSIIASGIMSPAINTQTDSRIINPDPVLHSNFSEANLMKRPVDQAFTNPALLMPLFMNGGQGQMASLFNPAVGGDNLWNSPQTKTPTAAGDAHQSSEKLRWNSWNQPSNM